MNRGMEIAPEVADSARSTIVEQVANGVSVRMAVLYLLLGRQGVTSVPVRGISVARRRADRPAAARRRDRRDRPATAEGRRADRRRGWSRCPASSTCTPTCASRAARTPRPSSPARGRRRSAATPRSARWRTPRRSPTRPASWSRCGGSAARPAWSTCSRSARSPSASAGEQLAELGAMADSAARVRIFSDDGHCVADPRLMRRALEYVKAFDGVIAQHAEEPRLTDRRADERGRGRPRRLGLAGWPAVAEEAIIARDVLLAGHVGARLHVCHVSTAGSVELIRWAKSRGLAGDRRGDAAPPAAHRRPAPSATTRCSR